MSTALVLGLALIVSTRAHRAPRAHKAAPASAVPTRTKPASAISPQAKPASVVSPRSPEVAPANAVSPRSPEAEAARVGSVQSIPPQAEPARAVPQKSRAVVDPPRSAVAPAPHPVATQTTAAPLPRAATIGPASAAPVLDLALGVRGFARSLSFTDDLFGALGSYSAPLSPMAMGTAEYYPGRAFTSGALGHIGLRVAGSYALNLRSHTADGASIATTFFDVAGGVRGRLPLGICELGVTFMVGLESYRLVTPTAPAAFDSINNLSVSYLALRPGVDARVQPLSWLALFARAELGPVLSQGPLHTLLPHGDGGVFAASAGIAIPIALGLEARISGSYRRYFLAFHPRKGDAVIAGGALDQFFDTTIALAWRMSPKGD